MSAACNHKRGALPISMTPPLPILVCETRNTHPAERKVGGGQMQAEDGEADFTKRSLLNCANVMLRLVPFRPSHLKKGRFLLAVNEGGWAVIPMRGDVHEHAHTAGSSL